MYYVYRFVDENGDILYVGKTTKIKERINEHRGKFGHLSDECYEKVKKIEYITVPTKMEMNIKEIYYIGLLNPQYNTVYKPKEEPLSLELDISNDLWRDYDQKEETDIEGNGFECESQIRFVKLKRVVEDLERLKDRYEELKLLIADQVRDNQIDEAVENIEDLQEIKKAIEQMENLEVKIS